MHHGGLFYCPSHLHAVGYFDDDWARDPIDRRSISGYCTFMGDNLIISHSKKYTVVLNSNVEAEYQVMAYTSCELIWIRSLLSEMGVVSSRSKVMHCNNQAAMYITNNHVFHERTKHIEVDSHFIRAMAMAKQMIVTSYVTSIAQLSDIFTSKKLGM